MFNLFYLAFETTPLNRFFNGLRPVLNNYFANNLNFSQKKSPCDTNKVFLVTWRFPGSRFKLKRAS